MQSSFHTSGLHVGCIMDGNGRWAIQHGRPRTAGHKAGAEATRRVVEAALSLDVGVLTLYAFSADNWRRPSGEVAALMTLLRAYLRTETPRLKRSGVRLVGIGRRDRLPEGVRAALVRAEWETRHGDRLLLRIALDYSAREALCAAAQRWARTASDLDTPPSPTVLGRHLHEAMHSPEVPPVDLLLRTGGDQRLSDFLLFESAYTELLFLDTLWPDMTGSVLAQAVDAFHGRERRFGGLAPSAPVLAHAIAG